MSSQANITTLNQLVNNFRDIVDKHQIIRRFEYGNPTDYYQSGTTDSPELWMHVDTITRDNGGVSTFDCTLTLADEIIREGTNELEVESDLVLLADDIVAQCYIKSPEYGWSVPRSQTTQYQIFTEDRKTPKNLKLLQFNLQIRVKKASDTCSIPYSSEPIT